MQLALPTAVRTIITALADGGGRPLIVGGAVRDALLGDTPKDFDVEVYGLAPEAVVGILATVGAVNAVGVTFGVLKVALADAEIDVTLPRRENKVGRGHRGFLVDLDPTMTPEEAARRRDFTINAMAYDPLRGELLDYCGGLDDLRSRVLRHAGPAFAEDPLRVLRGVQFAGRFDLRAASATLDLSRRLFAEHRELTIERVWNEWRKWAAKSRRPSAGLVLLEEAGWRVAHPELEALAGCPQDPRWHPEGDVWTHTLLVCDEAARVAERDALAPDDRMTLVLAALCHDLGKPATTADTSEGVRSPAHAAAEETYRQFLTRIGAPAKVTDRVVALSRAHLTHLDFAGSARHVRRLARTLGEAGETIEMLARLVEADEGGRPPYPARMPSQMADLLAKARELAAADAAPRPLLLGRHLLEVGFPAGPALGAILDQAYEAQLDGAFDTVEDARRWVLARRRPPGAETKCSTD